MTAPNISSLYSKRINISKEPTVKTKQDLLTVKSRKNTAKKVVALKKFFEDTALPLYRDKLKNYPH